MTPRCSRRPATTAFTSRTGARLIPDYEALRVAALGTGACAFMISGSGSTMLAVPTATRAAARTAAALAETCPGYWLRTLPANTLGTTVEVH